MDFLQRIWQVIPGGEIPGEVGTISAVLGVDAFFPAWLWQKLRRNKPEMHDAQDGESLKPDAEDNNHIEQDSERLKRVEEDRERLKRIKDILIGRARAQSAFLPGGDQPGAKQAEAIIEQDIGAAISTLANGGTIAAAEAAERGDTKAADDALAAKIAKIEPSRQGAAKEEAALYRQRGGLAYTDDIQAALRFYATAAELDPEDIEGLFSLAQLQIRAGYHPAHKQNLERLIAIENRIEDEEQRQWADVPPEGFEAALGDRNAASGLYERTKTLVHEQSQRDPDYAEWQQHLSVSYDFADDFSAAGGDPDAALDTSDGPGMRKMLPARDPGNAEYQSDRYENQDRFSISADSRDHDGALKTYSDGLEMAKMLAACDPDNAELQRDLSVSYNLIGDLSASRGDPDGALKAYSDGLAIAKDLAARDPNNAEWQRDLSVAYDRVGDISAGRGDHDGALKAYSDGLEIAKRLAAHDPSNAEWQHDLSVSYDRVGDISAARGDRDGALKAYSDGLEIRKKLAACDPNNPEWQRDLSVSYDRVGDISAACGDRDSALKAYKDGHDIAEELAARDPGNAERQTDLAVSAWKLAEAGAKDKRQHLASGLAILRRLHAEGKLRADQMGWIAMFEGAMQEPGEGEPHG